MIDTHTLCLCIITFCLYILFKKCINITTFKKLNTFLIDY